MLSAQLFSTYFLQGFAYGFFYRLVRLFLFVDIIEGKEAVRREYILVQPIGFAHQTAETVALHGTLEERFGRPYQDLRLAFRRLPGHAQRPSRETLSVLIQSGYPFLPAQLIIF